MTMGKRYGAYNRRKQYKHITQKHRNTCSGCDNTDEILRECSRRMSFTASCLENGDENAIFSEKVTKISSKKQAEF